MNIHHLGIATKDINKAINQYILLGFKCNGDIIKDKDRNIFIQFMSKDGYLIELISCLDISKPSPIDTIIKNNRQLGAIPYHFCFEVDNLDKEIEEKKKNGFILIALPQRAIAFNNKKVAFLLDREIGIVELVEK